eukprot:TRINITY_DN2894_c0_g1_i2.p1 TRINITY_DN2894_c0_g1~~TRINITY_DN2894_c0_g1_i2.p1  ORF type:complete len:354 (+),score=61.32 TRINITY_DN2894_c0_g1_i2:66-1127(+)
MSQPSLQLVEKDGSVVDAVSLDIEECLTLESFASLIELYEYHSKTFIIARVKSCDRRDHTKHHYTHYSAHQLNKALFRKKGTEIFSRYHKSCPIVALNPFTNEDIVGEVHYYQVVPLPRKQETTSEIPEGKIQISQGEVIDDMNGLQASMALETGTKQVDSPRQKSIKATYIAEQEDTTGEVQIPDIHDPSSLSLPNLVSTEKECTPSVEVGQTTQQEQRMAICIGTDYNYIHSEDLQKIFLDNGIGDDSNILALSSSMQIHRNPMNLGDEPEMENLFNRIRAMQGRHRRRRVFYVPYHRAVSLGVAAAIYVTYCVAVFAISVQWVLLSSTSFKFSYLFQHRFASLVHAFFFQ